MRISGMCCGIDPEATSGGECHERDLQIALKPLAHTEIFLARGKPFPRELASWIVPISPRHGLRWPVMAVVGAHALVRRGRQAWMPDVLRAHSLRGPGLAAIWARRILKRPVVVHVHHLEITVAALDRAIIRAADVVTVLSTFTARDVHERIGIAVDRIVVVGAGAPDPDRWRSSTPNRRVKPRVLFLGELKARKNVAWLLLAWRVFESAWPTARARLHIVGDGPERANLERQASGMRVIFHGAVSSAHKSIYYAGADLFVFPSRLEGFGMPVLEAMASGVPVLCSDRGALPEMAGLGVTILPLEAGPWAGAIAQHLSPALDEWRARAGADNRARAAEHTWHRVAERTIAACELAIDG